MKTAKIITVQVTRTDSGLLRATSEDLVGLHAVAKDEPSLRHVVCEMLTDLFEAMGEKVSVYEAEAKDDLPPPWVVIPNSSGVAAC